MAEASWFEDSLKALEADATQVPPPASALGHREKAFDIDLRSLRFLSLFDLLNLFLLIDLAHVTRGRSRVLLAGLNIGDEAPLTVEQYNAARRRAKSDEVSSAAFMQSHATYSFLAFINYLGLFSSLNIAREAGRVSIPGLGNDVLDKLYIYSGIGKTGSKVLPLCPIFGQNEVDQFRTQATILAWLAELPKDIVRLPLFKDGEFARVLGFQLGKNMLDHAGEDWRGPYGALGAIAMRVLPAGASESWVRRSVPEKALACFGHDRQLGVLELCVGDRGVGIAASLGDTYRTLRQRYGHTSAITSPDIVAFAFDKMGSRKPMSEQWGGAHALHRILRLTVKYAGYLRVRTSGCELCYDGTGDTLQLDAPPEQFGIVPSSAPTTLMHPYGLQLQLLLPLCPASVRPRRSATTSVTRPTRTAIPEPRIIPASAFFISGEVEPRNNEPLRLRLTALSHSLTEEPTTRRIGYSFEGRSWTEEDVSFFLESQKAVLHSHCCFGIGLESAVARNASDREAEGSESNDSGEARRFFDVLSVKHRLFPVVTRDHNVVWLGLGRYPLADAFTALLDSAKGLPLPDLCAIAHCDETSAEAGALQLYLFHNRDMFQPLPCPALQLEVEGHGWAALLRRSDLLAAASRDVAARIEQLMQDSGCVHKGGLYKLPSREHFTRVFVETTPLLQDEDSRRQIGAWMSGPLREFLRDGEQEVALITATAPALLLAKAIADASPDLKIHHLDIGHAFSLDEHNLLRASEWHIPMLIVADIVDTSTTVHRIERLLTDRGMTPRGLLALLRFSEPGAPFAIKNVYAWDPYPNETTRGRFFLADMPRPESVSQEQAEHCTEEELHIVEPYSLHPFSYKSLRALGRRGSAIMPGAEGETTARIQLMEDVSALRLGHWIYGDHHFQATVCIPTLFAADASAGPICDAVCRLCVAHTITHILAPLHSHIGDLLPRVQSALQIVYKASIPQIYCVSTQMLARRPFYVLPDMLSRHIHRLARQKSSQERLRLLVVDDAVASGRTLETILRAVILTCRSAIDGRSAASCPVEAVHAFTVLDRQPLSRSSVWSGVKWIAVRDGARGKGRPVGFDFSFVRWLDVDMPAENADSCPACRERAELMSMMEASDVAAEHGALDVVKDRVEELLPMSTEIPRFLQLRNTPLSEPLQIGRFAAVRTVELALWEFNNLLYRGYPYSELIKFYVAVRSLEQRAADAHSQLRAQRDDQRAAAAAEKVCAAFRLRTEVLRILMRDVTAIASQGADAAIGDAVAADLDAGDDIVQILLSEAGAALGQCAFEEGNRVRMRLEQLCIAAVHRIADLSDAVDSDGTRRLNLGFGCVAYCAHHKHYAEVTAVRKNCPPAVLPLAVRNAIAEAMTKAAGFSAEMLIQVQRAARSAAGRDRFLPAFITVLEHTVRSQRHSHSHLLPSRLRKIARGETASLSERASLNAMLAELSHCFHLVAERLPLALLPDALGTLQDRIRRVRTLLSGWLDATPPSTALRRAACDLRNIFPYQGSSRLLPTLSSMVVDLDSVLAEVAKRARADGIIVLRPPGDMPAKGLYVLAPNEESLRAVLVNYACVPVDRAFCSTPALALQVRPAHSDDGIVRVVIEIVTNYRPAPEAPTQIPIGSQMVGLAGRTYKLFDLAATTAPIHTGLGDDISPAPTSCIQVRVCVGFHLPQENLL